MVTKQKGREVILRWIDTVSSRDTTAIDQMADEIYAAGYVWHFPGVRDLPPGPTGMKQVIRNILADNPDFRATIEDLVVEGDKLAARCTMRRTDPASGKPQHGTNLDISRFAGDKIVEEWELISSWEDD